MARIEIDTSEFVALSASYSAASEEVGKLANMIVRKTAHDIAADAKNFVPVDTGNLKGSIGTDATANGGGAYEAVIGPTASYGIYVEQGTSRMAPHLYMSGALDRRQPAFVQAMEQLAERAANGNT
ncbi:MAG TPA: HK97-gp10 family putative phage morphogenesis protein [Arthrobacter sp.]